MSILSLLFESFIDGCITVGAFLSLLCVILLLVTWYRIPRWRTTQNFISVNQIFCGTIHIWCVCFGPFIFNEKMMLINGILFQSSLFWALCASFVAYRKLVLIQSIKINYEKQKYFVFNFGMTIITKIITESIVLKMFSDELPNANYNLPGNMLVSFIIMTLNFAIFINITVSVISCFKPTLSPRNAKHVISLLCLGLICDSTTLISMLMIMMENEVLMNIGSFLWSMRLIPQTAFVLWRRSSRIFCFSSPKRSNRLL